MRSTPLESLSSVLERTSNHPRLLCRIVITSHPELHRTSINTEQEITAEDFELEKSLTAEDLSSIWYSTSFKDSHKP